MSPEEIALVRSAIIEKLLNLKTFNQSPEIQDKLRNILLKLK